MNITIPPEALEAAARSLCRDGKLFWPDLTKDEQNILRRGARAACLAMLKTWPGMGIDTHDNIILPPVQGERQC